MRAKDLFPQIMEEEFEESVRVDRELGIDEKIKLIENYHLTDKTIDILIDIFARIRGEKQDIRIGWNHWLYGYYGSGKSHLLVLLSLILDSDFVSKVGREKVWQSLVGDKDSEELFGSWKEILSEYYVKTLPINLLKYQGRNQIGYNEVILQSMHVEQGFSNDISMAYFEKWLKKQTKEWKNRNEIALEIIKGKLGKETLEKLDKENIWEEVQKYQLLSETVKYEFFKRITNQENGLKDLIPSSLKPEMVIEDMQAWRKSYEERKNKECKIIVLLDEVTLFIGTDYDKLTELNVLAEKIDEIGRGNLINIVTAQERIEEVEPEYKVHRADFAILKDRFPHRYSLPSSHVGDIVQKRLLDSTEKKKKSERILKEYKFSPEDVMLFSGIEKNTSPPLDKIKNDDLLEYFPILPYHPPLFLEILRNMRKKGDRKAKSVFTGTARAILALVRALIEEWIRKDDIQEMINLPDLFNIIEYELEDIDKIDYSIIEEIDDDPETNDFDLKVSKVVYLLKFVNDMIPISESENIAVALKQNFKSESIYSLQNRIEDSLERMEKYIIFEKSGLRFTSLEEREIFDEAQRYKSVDLSELFGVFEKEIWNLIFQNYNFPQTINFRGSDRESELCYKFYIQGKKVEEGYGSKEGLKVEIVIKGLLNASNEDDIFIKSEKDKIVWEIRNNNSIEDKLRQVLPLQKACKNKSVPPVIKERLENDKEELIKDIMKILDAGKIRFKGKKYNSLNQAVKVHLDNTYPNSFRPIMNDVRERDILQLKNVYEKKDLPEWGEKLELLQEISELEDEVKPIVGRFLKENGPTTVNRILQEVEKDHMGDIRPSMAAIIWSMCKKGIFMVEDQDGKPRSEEVLLVSNNWPEIKIKIGLQKNIEEYFVKYIPGVTKMDTLNMAMDKTKSEIDNRLEDLEDIKQDLKLEVDFVENNLLQDLINNFCSEIDEKIQSGKSFQGALKERQDDWETFLRRISNWRTTVKQYHKVFNRKIKYIYQLDVLFLLLSEEVQWVNDNIKSQINELKKEITINLDIEWWSEEGWDSFSEKTSSKYKIIDLLEENWCDARKKINFIDKAKNKNWFEALENLPPNTSLNGFTNKVIRPIKNLIMVVDEWQEFIDTLKIKEDINKSEITKACNQLIDLKLKMNLNPQKIKDIENVYYQLEKLSKEVNISDVDIIGYWEQDRKKVKRKIQDLCNNKEIKIEEVEGGVIIK